MKTKISRALHQESGVYMCAGIVEKRKKKKTKFLKNERKEKESKRM